MKKKNTEVRDIDKKLKEIKDNMQDWYNYFSVNYERGRKYKYFLLVSQWDAYDIEMLQRLKIPKLSFNKLYDIVKKIIGQQREMGYNLQVRPVEVDESTQNKEELQERMNLIEGIVRHIGYGSHACRIYEQGFKDALEVGYGAWYIDHDYAGPNTFNQKITINNLTVPEQAFFDPKAKDTTKTDGEYAGYSFAIPLEEYRRLYPDYPHPVSLAPEAYTQFFKWGDTSDDTVTVAVYYEKEYFKKTLYALENNQVVTEDEYSEMIEMYKKHKMPIPAIENKRQSNDYKIIKYMITENYILEREEFPSKVLPVIYVDGDSYYVEGRQRTQPFIRFAKDSQRFLNYVGVAIAQSIKNARKETFIGTPDNVKGNEKVWQQPETVQGILLATPDRKTGGMPEKLPPSEVPQTLMANFERAANDIQSILGFYNANLGAPTDEVSGVAINNKVRQGNAAVYVYQDNLLRAIEDTGRVILSMLPRIYDNERSVPMLKQDGNIQYATVNTSDEQGEMQNSLADMDYDIEISAGPRFEVQKEQTLNVLMQFAAILKDAEPQAFMALLPKIAANLDVENTPQIVDILNQFVPDNIKQMESGEPVTPPPPPPPSPEMMAQQQAMQLKQQELALKARKQQLDEQDTMMEHANKQAQNRIDAAKIFIENQALEQEANNKKLDIVAELHKAALDYQGNRVDALASVLSKVKH